jgi:hypothetical protein
VVASPKVAPVVTFSPVYSPLVVKAGSLLRQSSIMKSWKPCVGVITIDGYFHVFPAATDVLTTDAELSRLSSIAFRYLLFLPVLDSRLRNVS